MLSAALKFGTKKGCINVNHGTKFGCNSHKIINNFSWIITPPTGKPLMAGSRKSAWR